METSVINKLIEKIGPGKVSTDPSLLDQRRHDYWALSHLRDFIDQGNEQPGCVVQPESTADVQVIVRIAQQHKIALIPFGLGSGVCGGVLANADSILLDMSKMNRVRSIDSHNLLATFDAGVNGLDAEHAVADLGMTIGHWPQSIALSTVGGWVATRASGQFSTAYGNIENCVYSIEAVLPNGNIINAGKAPRAAAGPDLRQLLLGSEGTLAVITGVTFSLRRKPGMQMHSAFQATSMAQGIAAQREIVQSGWLPPVMRLYDNTEVKRTFPEAATTPDGKDCALLLLVHEGDEAVVTIEQEKIAQLALEQGLLRTSDTVVGQWLEHRNQVSPWTVFFERNLVVDTVEISSTWDRIDAIYDDAIGRLNKLPGVLNASAHSSHVYRSGINLYFSFAAARDNPKDLPQAYLDCWDAIMQATSHNGGGISHHHGIGRIRSKYLSMDIGDSGMDVLRRVKHAIDPDNIMNPGVLLENA